MVSRMWKGERHEEEGGFSSPLSQEGQLSALRWWGAPSCPQRGKCWQSVRSQGEGEGAPERIPPRPIKWGEVEIEGHFDWGSSVSSSFEIWGSKS